MSAQQPTSSQAPLSWLYLLNAAILITHQIDAAYWHEWDLFGLPGGIQLNLLLNLPIVALILMGQHRLTQGRPAGIVFSWLLVAGGLSAVSIHSYFLMQGDASFRLPVSLALLIATFGVSLAQAMVLLYTKPIVGMPPTAD